MRFEGQKGGGQAARLSHRLRALEDRLVPAVDAVEIADGDDGPFKSRRRPIGIEREDETAGKGGQIRIETVRGQGASDGGPRRTLPRWTAGVKRKAGATGGAGFVYEDRGSTNALTDSQVT